MTGRTLVDEKNALIRAIVAADIMLTTNVWAEKVYLFGSVARACDSDKDVDMIVEVPRHLALKFLKRVDQKTGNKYRDLIQARLEAAIEILNIDPETSDFLSIITYGVFLFELRGLDLDEKMRLKRLKLDVILLPEGWFNGDPEVETFFEKEPNFLELVRKDALLFDQEIGWFEKVGEEGSLQ